MTDELKAKALKRDVLPRLQASRVLDQSKLDQMMRIADAALKLTLRPGHGPFSGWGIRRDHLDDFIRELERRPGFQAFDPADHVEASPMERLRRANRDAASRQ